MKKLLLIFTFLIFIAVGSTVADKFHTYTGVDVWVPDGWTLEYPSYVSLQTNVEDLGHYLLLRHKKEVIVTRVIRWEELKYIPSKVTFKEHYEKKGYTILDIHESAVNHRIIMVIDDGVKTTIQGLRRVRSGDFIYVNATTVRPNGKTLNEKFNLVRKILHKSK